METRITGVVECFQKLKAQINEWEKSNKSPAVSPVKINQQFSFFSKIIQELSSQTLLARVLLPICGGVLSLTDVIAQIKQNGLKRADSQIDIAFPRSNLIPDCSIHQELNLSFIQPPFNRMQMQMTPDIGEIQDHNLYGSESNIDCIYQGGKSETSCYTSK